MYQDLPLSFVEIICKYLQQQIIKFKDVEDFEFDKITFKDVTYDFTVYEEEQLVRIKDDDTVFNISKYDTRSDYQNNEPILALLEWIESQVVFTVQDWINAFLNKYPVYHGCLFDIYTTSKDNYVIALKSDTGAFTYNGTASTIVDGVGYALITEGDANVIQITSGAPIDWCTDGEVFEDNALLSMMNAEHTLATLRKPDMQINDWKRLSEFDEITVCGIKVKVRGVDAIYFDYKENHYVVTASNNLSIDPIRSEVKEAGRAIYFHSLYIHFHTNEDKNFVQAIVSLLNKVLSSTEGKADV